LTTCLIDSTVSSNLPRELWWVGCIVLKIVVMYKSPRYNGVIVLNFSKHTIVCCPSIETRLLSTMLLFLHIQGIWKSVLLGKNCTKSHYFSKIALFSQNRTILYFLGKIALFCTFWAKSHYFALFLTYQNSFKSLEDSIALQKTKFFEILADFWVGIKEY